MKSRGEKQSNVEPRDASRTADRRWLAVILVGYLALALLYNAVTPVGKSPDEGPHAEYVRYLLNRHRFPVLTPKGGVTYEAHQPPLYYLIAAPVWAAVAAVSGDERHAGTEPAAAGSGNAADRSAYAPGSGAGPAENSVPARAVRVLTTLIGAFGLVLLWALARVLYRTDRWLPLAVTAFAAFLPMRVAMAAAVTNDVLLEALFTAGLLLMALMIRQGYTHRRAATLGAVMGAAMLTKATGVLLLPAALMAIMLASRVTVESVAPARRSRGRAPGPAPPRSQLDARAFFGGCALAFGIAAVLAGPWLVRNRILYGDFLGQSYFEQYFENAPHREQLMGQLGLTAFQYWFQWVMWWTYRSFWGTFGQMSIWMPPAVYTALLVPSTLALLGAIIHLLRARQVLDETQRSTWLILWLCLFLVISGFLRFNVIFFQAQGRYLTPAMAPIALLSVIGWFIFVPPRARPTTTLFLGVALGALSLYGALGVIAPYLRAHP
jgi:4-amino-4-deoxy-L-arabinose transferase-like glycosyltransferase